MSVFAHSTGWDVVRETYSDKIVEDHLIPADDFREHYTSRNDFGCTCWCKPEYRDTTDTVLYSEVIHNSADGREKFEEGLCLRN